VFKPALFSGINLIFATATFANPLSTVPVIIRPSDPAFFHPAIHFRVHAQQTLLATLEIFGERILAVHESAHGTGDYNSHASVPKPSLDLHMCIPFRSVLIGG